MYKTNVQSFSVENISFVMYSTIVYCEHFNTLGEM